MLSVRRVAALSMTYDVLLGIALLFFQPEVIAWWGLPLPNYPVNGNLNGLFTLAIGIGYLAPYRSPLNHRWYVWLMGVGLKGVGPFVFLYDYALRHGPPSFLWFAVSDGVLALASLAALLRKR